jgi:hypothetical protein
MEANNQVVVMCMYALELDIVSWGVLRSRANICGGTFVTRPTGHLLELQHLQKKSRILVCSFFAVNFWVQLELSSSGSNSSAKNLWGTIIYIYTLSHASIL